jgi:hypothetical protein
MGGYAHDNLTLRACLPAMQLGAHSAMLAQPGHTTLLPILTLRKTVIH